MKLGEAGEAYFVDESSREGDDESSSSCESLIEGGVLNELKRAKSTEPLRDKNRSDGNSTPPITITDVNKNVTMKSIDESNTNEISIPKVMNFFSDGEITPEMTSPVVSRPPSPKSDTEAELISNMKVYLKFYKGFSMK